LDCLRVDRGEAKDQSLCGIIGCSLKVPSGYLIK